MTRDEAIEAGARVVAQHTAWATTGPDEVTGRWDVICYDCGLRLGDRAEIIAGASRADGRPLYAALARHQAEMILDAVGWAEPDCDHIWERELSSEWATCARCGAKVTWPTWSGPMRYGAPDTPDQQRLANAAGG